MNDPIRDLDREFDARRGSLQPPSVYADDLKSPLNALDAVRSTLDAAAAEVHRLRQQRDDGLISDDQLGRLTERIADEAAAAADQTITVGWKVVQALPERLRKDAWPSVPARTPEAALARDDLRHALDQVPEERILMAFTEYATSALREGDRETPRLAMSRWGENYLRARTGMDDRDFAKVWASVREHVTAAAAEHGTGLVRKASAALVGMREVEQAFIVGREAVRHRAERLKERRTGTGVR